MKFEKVEVGCTYRVKTNISRYASSGTSPCDYSTGKSVSIVRGTILKCLSKNECQRHSTFETVGMYEGSKKTHKFTFTNHTDLEPVNVDCTAESLSLTSRQQRTKVLSRIADEAREKIKVLEQELKLVKDKLREDDDQLLLLRRFDSDEEELAFTISNIVKTGGNEVEILKILQARKKTSLL